MSVCADQAADNPKAIYGGRISPFHSWSFERMILKPHTSYPVRQIKRPFFLASIPTKDKCSYVQVDHGSDYPPRLTTLHVFGVSPKRANTSVLWAEFSPPSIDVITVYSITSTHRK